MGSPWSEQREQKFERELKTVTLACPGDHDLQTTVGAPLTTACERMINVVENLDEDLWHRLPEDILPKIFARLPFCSLFKIRLLSKAWGEHIQSPSFQLEATSDVLASWESYSPLLCSSTQDMRMIAYCSASRRWESLFSLSYLFAKGQSSARWRITSVVGSMLCLKQVGEPGRRGLLVTNSVLKSWRVLPPHGLMTPFLPAYEIVHLVVSSQEEDSTTYKVISISQDSSIRDPCKRIPPQVPQDSIFPLPHLRAEIYDSATGAWRVDESGPVMPMDLHNVSSVYVGGVLYFSLASSRYESFHLFAYNIMSGSWTTIPYTHESGSLVQLARCGSSVILVLSSPAAPHGYPRGQRRKINFGPSSDDSQISEGSIYIYEIGTDLKITKVSGGPAECIQGVKVVEGVSGDDESIYLQAFGRPLVAVFNVKQKLWSTVAVRLDSNNVTDDSEKLLKLSSRYIGPCFDWTNLTFQPGLNSFVAP